MKVDNSLSTDVLDGAAVTLAALVLFFHADRLSQSTAFRLSSGGLLGVTGMAAILLLIVIRCALRLRSGASLLLLLLETSSAASLLSHGTSCRVPKTVPATLLMPLKGFLLTL